MNRAARRFHRRYYLSLGLLYPLAATVLAYGISWALIRAITIPSNWTLWPLLSVAIFSVMWSWLLEIACCMCFTYAGLPKLRCSSPVEQELAASLLSVDSLAANWTVRLAELGEVPYLGISATTPPELWISTHTARTMPLDYLRGMVVHEAAHVALGHSSFLRQPLSSLT
jgi:Zn-dependent protease with chaperone function